MNATETAGGIEVVSLDGDQEGRQWLEQRIARDVDSTSVKPAEHASETNREPEPDTEVETPPAPETETTQTPTPGTETTPATPAPKTETTPTETPPEPPPVSRYKKAQERLEKTWEATNKRKTELDDRELKIKEREAALEEAKKQSEEPEFTPEQCDAQADEYEKRGKFDLADIARQKAVDLRANPPSIQKQFDKLQQGVETGQRASYAKLSQNPAAVEALKLGTPMNKRMQELVQSEGDVWKWVPNAPELLFRVAQGEISGARVAEVEKELATAKAKIKELETLVTPGGGGGTRPPLKAKSFNQMSESEQKQFLKRESEKMDG